MKNFTIRSRIILLVVLAALPALALTIYSTWDERVRTAAHAREDLQRITLQAAQQIAQIVEGTRHTLIAISLLPSTLHNDQVRCNAYLAQLLTRSQGIFHSVGLYDTDSLLICNAIPWKGKVYSLDRTYLQLPLKTGKFAIGDYQIGRVTRQQGINFGYPVTDAENRVRGVAFLALDLASFRHITAAVPLPAHGILTVTDRIGTVLASFPEQAESVGHQLRAPAIQESLLSARQGVFENRDNVGVDRLFAFQSVTENPDGNIPLRVMISLPLSVVFADANATLVRNLICVAVATLLLLAAAGYGAEVFVLRRIKALVDVAHRVETGSLSARSGLIHGSDELAQLGNAFDTMANALEVRDADIQKEILDLKAQAVTDALTGLYNRRFLLDLLPRELARARRKSAHLAVFMIDIDHFKRVNDTCGHECGDLVLKAVAHAITQTMRGSDYTCRYGGEEIAVVLPDVLPAGACDRAQSLRTVIEALETEDIAHRLVRVTVSIGVAIFPQDGGDANALLRAADEALHSAKGAGRNRVMVHAAGTA
ncbi:MAG: hypothetical protein JWN94_473 [Betaproteobacteria bacterium]|nr:hypothetical protein [Betaproteobacteria bacterium]